ncbi:hypothetical protein V6N12_022105 [Hibiscus sabdariffa]|uniref:Uncharacterized protein n=1 Tax=Hibiscus sabdariffa TaxID=183260 RepID=A0ABR2FTN7_9ROSI
MGVHDKSLLNYQSLIGNNAEESGGPVAVVQLLKNEDGPVWYHQISCGRKTVTSKRKWENVGLNSLLENPTAERFKSKIEYWSNSVFASNSDCEKYGQLTMSNIRNHARDRWHHDHYEVLASVKSVTMSNILNNNKVRQIFRAESNPIARMDQLLHRQDATKCTPLVLAGCLGQCCRVQTPPRM